MMARASDRDRRAFGRDVSPSEVLGQGASDQLAVHARIEWLEWNRLHAREFLYRTMSSAKSSCGSEAGRR
jgi:hypothetical protein